MAKPEKVRYSGVAVMADGVQMKRVQSFDASVDIGQEQVLELSNSGIVQYIDQTPTVSISIDTNLYGSVDNASLLGNKLITDATDNNWEDGREGFYSHKIETLNNLTVTEQDFLNAYVTLAVPILEETTAVARCMVIPRAAMTGYSLNFDVGGLATENFTLQAADKYWYLNTWKDARVFKMTNWHIGDSASATNTRIQPTGTSQGFVHLGTAIAASSKATAELYGPGQPVALIVNDRVFRSTAGGNGPYHFNTAATLSGDETAGTGGIVRMGIDGNLPVGVSTPYAVEGDDVYLVYVPVRQTWDGSNTVADSADPGYALVSTSGSYGGVGKGFIDAYLYNTDGPPLEKTSTTVGRALRLQTISIDISLSAENLDELGSFQSYGVLRNPPVPVNVTVTANDSDLEQWALACASAVGGTGTYELNTELFSQANILRIDVYREKTKATKLETIIVDSMTVAGDSHNVAVGGNAAQEFTFTADNLSLFGLGVAV